MFQNLINLFFPNVCVGCNSFLLANEKVICTTCRHEIPLTYHHNNLENEAFKKFYGKIPVAFVSTFVYFHKRGIVQKLIHNLKYKGHEEIGTVMGDWYAMELQDLPQINTIDCIIPVPIHKRKLRERGYNQVTTFGKSLSENLGIAYNDSLLLRKIYSKTQTKKNLLRRSEVNDQNIFDVSFSKKDHNKHYLLVDDVLTTGATLEACSRALLKIPNIKISIVCIAMTH